MELVSGVVILPGQFITHVLFSGALLALWIPKRFRAGLLRYRPWIVLLFVSLGLALLNGLITPLALVPVVALGIASFYWSRSKNSLLTFVTSVLIILISYGLAAHLFPGYLNPKLISELRLSPDAASYTKYLNLDKPLIGIFILGFTHSLFTSLKQWKTMLVAGFPIALGTIIVVVIVGLLLRYVRIDLKFGAIFWVWGWQNLFYTCIVEEAFFRGFLQKNLASLLGNSKTGGLISLIVTALFFGLAHYAGGINYIILSTIAGLGYGFVYQKTASIEASILTHFFLNTVHFLALTYPVLA